IHREGLKRLFSSILKREGGDYYLVTPAEKWRIEVDDVPFFVTGVERVVRDGQEALLFETATGERVVAGQAHPLRVVIDPESGEPAPYLLVRDGMEGLLARGVFYQLADWACGGPEKKQAVQGVYSLGVFFPLEGLHVGVVGAAAAFRGYPDNVLGGVLDIAGLAVDTVLGIDLEALAAVVVAHHLVDPRRAVALGGLVEHRQVVADGNVRVLEGEVDRLILLVVGVGHEHR